MFICAAPHCLKSFLDRTEFETHVHKTHSDLGQTNINKERSNEPDAFNIPQPSSTDIQKQNLLSESSTARAPLRSGFSLSSNSPVTDCGDSIRCHQSGDQPRQNPNLLWNPPAFQANLPQGHSQPPKNDNQSGLPQPPPPLQAPFSGYLPLPPHQPPNFAVTVKTNQPLESGFARPRGMPLRSGLPFSASDYCSSVPESSSLNQRFPCKEIQGGFTEQSEGKGVPASMPLQLHFPSQSLSPPLPPHLSVQPHFH